MDLLCDIHLYLLFGLPLEVLNSSEDVIEDSVITEDLWKYEVQK